MERLQAVMLMVVAVAGVSAAQPRVVVFEFEPVVVESRLAAVVGTLLRDRMTDTRAFTVLAPPTGAKCYSIDQASSVAWTLSADKVVLGSITQTGGKLLIYYRLVDLKSSLVEFSDRVTLDSEEEVDPATRRMAISLKTRKPYAATGPQAPENRESISSILFTTGFNVPIFHEITARTWANPGVMWFTFDAAVAYEAPTFLAQGIMGFEQGENSFKDLHFELLGHRMYPTGVVTPYVGGGIGVHRVLIGSSKSDGVSLAASGGALLFRTSYFRVISGVKATAVFTPNFGPIVTGALNLGLTSPGVGRGGKVQTPACCLYGVLGAFFLTGLIVALST